MKPKKTSAKKQAGKRDPGRAAITPEARQALDRVERESESIGTSSFARTADKTVRDTDAAHPAEDDEIEIWGKRIGRGLAIIVVIWLVYHLAITYVLPGLSD